MARPIRVSVVIPTYRRCASLRRALDALTHQTLPADAYEVIVSIDGSEDGTREMLAQFSAPYRLRANWQPNRGRAAACNVGIQMAVGEVLVLLDDDMEPTPELLAAHQAAHTAGSRLGVIAAAPIAIDQSSPPIMAYIGAKFNRHLERLATPGHAMQLRDFYSGNFSIRRDVLREVGAFDEAFKIYGNEDLELSLRLSRADVRLVYCPEAVAHQHYTKDFAATARDNLAKGRTAVLLAGKHPDALDDLQLSTYRRASRKWHLLRGGLLGLSRLRPSTSALVIRIGQWLERLRLPQLHTYYALALDYFYWLGAEAAMRENRRAGVGLTALPEPAERPRL